MNRAQSALQFVSPIERSVWVEMGMALHSQFGDAARDIWMDWSRQADSFRELDARSVWKSFHGTGVTIASLYREARCNGWHDEGFQKPTEQQIEAQRRAAAERLTKEGQDRIRLARDAAKKADWILNQCKPELHAYLFFKGFKEMKGLVWRPDDQANLLCVPMYVGHNIAGLQMIDKEGVKKFLTGQVTSKAEYCIDAGGIGATDWWCEGFASGLSLRECLQALKLHYRIHITFSANNLKRMAHSGYVVADNDESDAGRQAAIATGLPYWMSAEPGEDINDVWVRQGTFRTSQQIGKWLRELRESRATG